MNKNQNSNAAELKEEDTKEILAKQLKSKMRQKYNAIQKQGTRDSTKLEKAPISFSRQASIEDNDDIKSDDENDNERPIRVPSLHSITKMDSLSVSVTTPINHDINGQLSHDSTGNQSVTKSYSIQDYIANYNSQSQQALRGMSLSV